MAHVWRPGQFSSFYLCMSPGIKPGSCGLLGKCLYTLIHLAGSMTGLSYDNIVAQYLK